MVQLFAKYGKKIFALCSMFIAMQTFAAANDTIKLDFCDFLTTSQELTQYERDSMCNICGILQKAPEYYCDCHMGPRFYFGMDTVIADTTWFSLNIGTIRNHGFQLYWFSENGIMAELFAQCVQTAPMRTQVVGKNREYGLLPKEVNDMLGSLGSGEQLNNNNVRLRVYPVDGKPGRVLGYPAEEGFVSTCPEPFRLHYGMTFFVSLPVTENVYELFPEDLPASMPVVNEDHTNTVYSSELFVRKDGGEEKSKADFFITYGACDGPVVYQTVIKDTIDLHFPPRDIIKKAKQDSVSLFFHFKADDAFGFMVSKHTRWEPRAFVDTLLCGGMGLELADTTLMEATVYTDTVRVENSSALQRVTYNLNVQSSEPIDTLVQKFASELPFRFLGYYNVKNFGTYEVTQKVKGECDRHYNLTVERLFYEESETFDTTLCQGAVFVYKKVQYTTSQVVSDTIWKGDTRKVTTYNLHFTAPELEYDTLRILPSVLPYKYHGTVIEDFGEHRVYIKGVDGDCDREVLLLVESSKNPLTVVYNTVDTTICKGMHIHLPDTTLDQPTTFVDSTYIEKEKGDTLVITTYNVAVTLPELEIDTVKTERFPAHYLDTTINDYGTYTVYFEGEHKCDRIIQVTFRPYGIKYTLTRVDTTLCQGKVFELNDKVLTTTGYVYDTIPTAEYFADVIQYHVQFSTPETVRDTIVISQDELPYDYQGHSITTFGDHLILIHEEGECDVNVELNVQQVTGLNYTLHHQLQVRPTIVNVGDVIEMSIPAEGLLQVIDMLGKVVLNEQVTSTVDKTITMEVAGNYLLRLTTDKGVYTKRVIVH